MTVTRKRCSNCDEAPGVQDRKRQMHVISVVAVDVVDTGSSLD